MICPEGPLPSNLSPFHLSRGIVRVYIGFELSRLGGTSGSSVWKSEAGTRFMPPSSSTTSLGIAIVDLRTILNFVPEIWNIY